MARAKKDGKRVNFYMKAQVVDMLDLYCAEVGQTKTEAAERILRCYLEKYFTYKRQGETVKSAELENQFVYDNFGELMQ